MHIAVYDLCMDEAAATLVPWYPAPPVHWQPVPKQHYRKPSMLGPARRLTAKPGAAKFASRTLAILMAGKTYSYP